jgi:lysophospholipase L1-like esterase
MERPKLPRRQLRLKEWPPLIDRQLRPSPEYLLATDGSLRDIEYRVRTDADGYILPPPTDLDGVENTLIFFGDSFVESTYVPEDQRFVAVIQDILREAGVPARCLNAGYSGATSLHMLMSLLGKVGRRQSTTIILVIPSNDAFALIKEGGYWCRWDKRYSPVIPVPDSLRVPTQSLDLADLQSVINLFVDSCRRLRLNLVLASFPHRTELFKDDSWLLRRFKSKLNYDRTHDWRCSINASGRAIAKRLNIPFIDLEKLVSERIECFYDDLHMNELGSKEVADIIGSFLVAQRRTMNN